MVLEEGLNSRLGKNMKKGLERVTVSSLEVPVVFCAESLKTLPKRAFREMVPVGTHVLSAWLGQEAREESRRLEG